MGVTLEYQAECLRCDMEFSSDDRKVRDDWSKRHVETTKHTVKMGVKTK